MKIRKVILFFIGLAVGLVVFGLISGEIDWASVGKSFSSIRWWQLLLLLGLMEGSMVFASLAWRSVLGKEKSPPFFSLLKIFTVGFSLSYLTPMTLVGGEALRAYFLHQKEGLSWKKTIISIILHKLIVFSVLAGTVLIGLGIFFFLGGALSRRLGYLIFFIFLGIVVFLFLLFRHSSNHQSLISRLFLVLGLEQALEIKQMKTVLAYEKEALRFFRTQSRAFWEAVGFSALEVFCYLGQAFFIIAFLSGQWTVVGAFISYAFSGLSAFFILPAALGSLEVMEGFAFQGLGLALSLALTFSLIWRGLRLLICFSGGLITLQLMREIGWKSLRESKKQYIQHARESEIS